MMMMLMIWMTAALWISPAQDEHAAYVDGWWITTDGDADDDANLDIVDTASLKSAKEVSIKDQSGYQRLKMFVSNIF